MWKLLTQENAHRRKTFSYFLSVKREDASKESGEDGALRETACATGRWICRRRVALVLVKVFEIHAADFVGWRKFFTPTALSICIAACFCAISRRAYVFQRPEGLGACISVACRRGGNPRIARVIFHLTPVRLSLTLKAMAFTLTCRLNIQTNEVLSQSSKS
jgi:hypothetical protein